MFKRLTKNEGSRGSAAEVWINKEQRLIKKYYKVNGIGCRGNIIIENDQQILEHYWKTEIYWTKKFKKFAPALLDYGIEDKSFFIVQEYYAPDLLKNYVDKTLWDDYPNIKNDLIEFFEQCKEYNIYKFNHALSNMTGKNGKVKFFDFKYVEPRTISNRVSEIKSLHMWISKIDKDLVTILEKMI